MFDIVTASHKPEVLNENLGKSKAVTQYGMTVMNGYDNVSKAYNEAATISPLIIYVHHDVFLPDSFMEDLKRSLTDVPDDWGVLGVAGVKLIDGKKIVVGHVMDRGREWGNAKGLPAEVDTLDELILITRGNYQFDENLPQDFYGADICMKARLRGKKCYAIDAFCHHNSSRGFGERTDSFYTSLDYFKSKYRDHLPIATTCAIVS